MVCGEEAYVGKEEYFQYLILSYLLLPNSSVPPGEPPPQRHSHLRSLCRRTITEQWTELPHPYNFFVFLDLSGVTNPQFFMTTIRHGQPLAGYRPYPM